MSGLGAKLQHRPRRFKRQKLLGHLRNIRNLYLPARAISSILTGIAGRGAASN